MNTNSNSIWSRNPVCPAPVRRFSSLCLAILSLSAPGWLPGSALAGEATIAAGKQTLFYIPHTHWEGAVFKTREGYLEMGLQNILEAVRLLKEHPEYKFTLDQVAYFRPFLERYPEEAGAFRKFVAEGRLEIVGGMDVMPDDVKPGGELFVRQIQYGKEYCREALGVDVTVGWMLDTFGHHPQMPQIMRLAGYKSFWFSRGVASEDTASEFQWRGIDGTEIPAFWLPGSYGLFYEPPRDYTRFSRFFQERFNGLSPHTRAAERVGLAGADVSVPEDYAPALVSRFNQDPSAPFTIRYSVPTEFEAVVARRASKPVLTLDLNPIFQGTYSSRAELKARTRVIESTLLTAEKLGALANILGAPYEKGIGWKSWEPVLFNQTHDLASGVMTDIVYEDSVRGYDFAERLAGQATDKAWNGITGRIDTTGEGVPVMVFNTLGWSRSDLAEVEIGVAEAGMKGIRVLDPAGNAVPVEITGAERYGDGGLKLAKIAFVARSIPALGYSMFHVVPSREAGDSAMAGEGDPASNVIENEYYKVRLNPISGEMTGLLDKAAGWEALGGPANVVARQQDKGDLWELYRGLDGASHIAMTNQQPVPKAGEALLSSGFGGGRGKFHRGKVYSEFSVSHPLANGDFATTVRLYAGIRRIDVKTELVNNEKWVRYQALFPTSIREGRNFQEIPFGAVERPSGIEFPAQNWVDYGDGKHGVALLNVGMPGNLVSDGTLILSMMRSHNLGQYGYGGGYEPGMSSETGFELGRRISFRYGLVPHAGDWKDAGVVRSGMEFVHPLLARKVAAHAGVLPHRWGALSVSASNVVLTAFKTGAGGSTVARVYEAAGMATRGVKMRFSSEVKSAREANLMEDSGSRLKVKNDTVEFDLHPFEIKTIKLEMVGARKME